MIVKHINMQHMWSTFLKKKQISKENLCTLDMKVEFSFFSHTLAIIYWIQTHGSKKYDLCHTPICVCIYYGNKNILDVSNIKWKGVHQVHIPSGWWVSPTTKVSLISYSLKNMGFPFPNNVGIRYRGFNLHTNTCFDLFDYN